MGFFDVKCDNCKAAIEGKDLNILSKKTSSVYASQEEYMEKEGKVLGFMSYCGECIAPIAKKQLDISQILEKGKSDDIMFSTTDSLQGFRVNEYLGLVSAQVFSGANVFKDLLGAITDVVGGRSKTIEKVIANARGEALLEMADSAKKNGANVILGLKVDIEINSQSYIITAIGTSAIVSKYKDV